jgi:hypothetical protein
MTTGELRLWSLREQVAGKLADTADDLANQAEEK